VNPVAHGLEPSFVAFWPLWLFLLLGALGKADLIVFKHQRGVRGSALGRLARESAAGRVRLPGSTSATFCLGF
jgi:hypothetical protein